MLDKFIFENHLGIRFSGLEKGVFLNYSELRNYEWSYETINNRISRFYMGVKERKIPLVVCCNSDDEAVEVKNLLHELAESDIASNIPGKIFVGDYYTTGFIKRSDKSEYLIEKRYCKLDLTFASDDPAWYKEQTHAFSSGGTMESNFSGGIDYPYDYPFDYSLSLNGKKINCNTIGSNAFRLTIYGEAVNPTVIVGGHVYSVLGSIGKGETLMIDSLNKTITLTTANGNKVNWFDKRSRESYIFEPIQSGLQVVTWNGSFNFDLTIIEKRSEPRWT